MDTTAEGWGVRTVVLFAVALGEAHLDKQLVDLVATLVLPGAQAHGHIAAVDYALVHAPVPHQRKPEVRHRPAHPGAQCYKLLMWRCDIILAKWLQSIESHIPGTVLWLFVAAQADCKTSHASGFLYNAHAKSKLLHTVHCFRLV